MKAALRLAVAGMALTVMAACVPTDPPPPPPPGPPPAPVHLSGTGDEVVDLNPINYPAVARISYTGASNFVIWSHDPAGERIDLLVNTIGSYHGNRPLAFESDEPVATLEIRASGPWTIDIVARSTLGAQPTGVVLSNTGDDVFLVGGNPRTLDINAPNNTSNFIVTVHTPHWDLLVNEIGPYVGTVLLPAGDGPVTMEVRAGGPWSMRFS